MTDILTEMAIEFDRLRGTNVCLRGNDFDLAIDRACGRDTADAEDFAEFLTDVLSRVPAQVVL